MQLDYTEHFLAQKDENNIVHCLFQAQVVFQEIMIKTDKNDLVLIFLV